MIFVERELAQSAIGNQRQQWHFEHYQFFKRKGRIKLMEHEQHIVTERLHRDPFGCIAGKHIVQNSLLDATTGLFYLYEHAATPIYKREHLLQCRDGFSRWYTFPVVNLQRLHILQREVRYFTPAIGGGIDLCIVKTVLKLDMFSRANELSANFGEYKGRNELEAEAQKLKKKIFDGLSPKEKVKAVKKGK